LTKRIQNSIVYYKRFLAITLAVQTAENRGEQQKRPFLKEGQNVYIVYPIIKRVCEHLKIYTLNKKKIERRGKAKL
jgi:hypothetical protein